MKTPTSALPVCCRLPRVRRLCRYHGQGPMGQAGHHELGHGNEHGHGDAWEHEHGWHGDRYRLGEGTRRQVTFDVLNASKDTIHEMIVSPINGPDVSLPYVANEGRVNEDASGDLGEVSELDPGRAGSLTIELKPGYYALFCNVPGHFTAGMWTMIQVE